jgi:hypothetical protein
VRGHQGSGARSMVHRGGLSSCGDRACRTLSLHRRGPSPFKRSPYRGGQPSHVTGEIPGKRAETRGTGAIAPPAPQLVGPGPGDGRLLHHPLLLPDPARPRRRLLGHPAGALSPRPGMGPVWSASDRTAYTSGGLVPSGVNLLRPRELSLRCRAGSVRRPVGSGADPV